MFVDFPFFIKVFEFKVSDEFTTSGTRQATLKPAPITTKKG